jgi:methyltransferase (TIGR00027 family)
MKQNCPSLTANKVAVMRAAHQIIDKPKIFEDPIALSIIGNQGVSEIRSKKRKFKTRLHSYLRAIVVARSRFVEDELCMAIKQGIRQYVILGAGLDTFAYRNPYSDAGLRVFEIDYPATQEWKREQLNAVNVTKPESLTFVPIDFEKQSLQDRLQEVGFTADEPSLFSWLGVTMYLNKQTVMATMQYITSFTASGSMIIFDYTVPPSSQNFIRRFIFRLLAHKMAVIGEPWQTFFDPQQLAMDLKGIGFTKVEDFDPEKINSLFFSNRTDKLKVGSFGHLMKAKV